MTASNAVVKDSQTGVVTADLTAAARDDRQRTHRDHGTDSGHRPTPYSCAFPRHLRDYRVTYQGTRTGARFDVVEDRIFGACAATRASTELPSVPVGRPAAAAVVIPRCQLARQRLSVALAHDADRRRPVALSSRDESRRSRRAYRYCSAIAQDQLRHAVGLNGSRDIANDEHRPHRSFMLAHLSRD
jgi:hypothetical protein